jgi:serine/threonine protein kinase
MAPFEPPLSEDEIAAAFTGYSGIAKLGTGGQGTVFRADTPQGLSVALKLISPKQALVRGEREIDTLAALNTPNVAQLVARGKTVIRGEECLFFATAFYPGTDLRKRVATTGPMANEQVTQLIKSMCAVIDLLWSIRIVHCDIKPGNVLVGEDQVYRLIDLGLAKQLNAETVTQTGAILGTVGYMAPEQMRGRKNLTLRVDLFALGLVGYECLTGMHPFNRDQEAIGRGDAPKPLASLVQVSPPLERAINWLLAINPFLRPPSGVSVIKLLGG